MATSTLKPGTKVRLNAQGRATVENDPYRGDYEILDEYTLKEFGRIFPWWEMEEPYGDGPFLLFEAEFEVVE